MSFEKQLADTDSIYCTKSINSHQTSIFISNIGDPELDSLFGSDYKSDDSVRLRLDKRNLAFNSVAHVIDDCTWFKRNSNERWAIDSSWLKERLDTLNDAFSKNQEIFLASLNKDDRSTHRLYLKGLTSLAREDGNKSIALKDFLFSGDVIILTKLSNGDISFDVKLPDNPIISSERVRALSLATKNKLGLKDDDNFPPMIIPYLAAIRTKPFLLLAGISGTGKSRLVRQLAKATAGDLSGDDKPGNFELIPVKPNWHDSTELLGYVSRISGHPEYVMTDFVRFLFKATLYPEIPFFLCLDEMNLAPVEQYFAEYLSVIETRNRQEEGAPITTDVLVRFDEEIYQGSVKKQLEACYKRAFGSTEGFEEVSKSIAHDGGLRIPSNLVVIGTVNMDETTFSFSRKVLDRAMSFELNVVDMNEGVQEDNSSLAPIPADAIFQTCLNANDVFKATPSVANAVIERLKTINNALNNTPFKIAYRSRNEIMIYVCERLHDFPTAERPDEETLISSALFHQAMDEAISMKILSRIEGDEQRISSKFLEDLENAIKGGVVLSVLENDGTPETPQVLYPVCSKKIKQMQEQLTHGYVSFWS